MRELLWPVDGIPAAPFRKKGLAGSSAGFFGLESDK
jgi:hypothetical protein